MSHPLVALIEIGRTHAQLSVVDPQSGAETRGNRRANEVIQGAFTRELNVDAIGQWLMQALREAPNRERIRVVVPIVQGSAAVLLDRDGRVLAAPDCDDPRYWAWRLTGVMASEVTTDLLGPISPEVAAETGLDPACQVTCGILDSNLSYLKCLIERDRAAPFTVVASGTWTTIMANRGDVARLNQAPVDMFGAPVATAGFMGGHEYQAVAGIDARPNLPALLNVLERGVMALPAFAGGGPFAGREGRLVNADNLSGSERASVATLYVVLMSELLMEMLGAAGDVFIDGPFATHSVFGPLLASCLTERSVWLSTGDGSNARAACHLAGFHDAPSQAMTSAAPLALKPLPAYRQAWRALVQD